MIEMAWYYPINRAHSTLLVIHLDKKTIQNFDPSHANLLQDYTSYTGKTPTSVLMDLAKLKKFVPGYTFKIPPLDNAVNRVPFQSVMEELRTQHKLMVDEGMCNIVCALVLVLCNRFNIDDPWEMEYHLNNIFRDLDKLSQIKFVYHLDFWFAPSKRDAPVC
jgi:hypothetical protein